MNLWRRLFLQSVPAAVLMPRSSHSQALRPGAASVIEANRSFLLSMSEVHNGEHDNVKIVQQRFDLYKSLGCGGLRTNLGWRELEHKEGSWSRPKNLIDYYACSRRNFFRLKIQIGVVSAVPDWFFERYPDAKLVNQKGDSPRGYISPWYPNLRAILEEKTREMFKAAQEIGALETTDYIIVDLGPAGEPTYPAAWHMGRGYTPASSVFWYFDLYAQADFGKKMQLKYHDDLQRANTHWGTHYRNWIEVLPPVPNTIKGAIWLDLLSWYYDTKRRLIINQIASTKYNITQYSPTRPIRPLLLLPGDHATQEDFDLTASNGVGTYLVKIAADTEFIVDQAEATDSWLQFG